MSPPGSDPRRPGAGPGRPGRTLAASRPAPPRRDGRQGAPRPGGGPARSRPAPPSPAIARWRRAGVLVVLAAAAGLGLLGARSLGGLGSPPVAPRARAAARHAGIEVGTARCSFVERTATPTYDFLTRAESTQRDIVADVRYPSLDGRPSGAPGARPDVAGGPFPAVVFAPGYRLDPASYAPLLDAWVRSGLVVVGVRFPYTNPAAYARAMALAPRANPEADLANEPADVAFVARQVVADSAGADGACAVLAGLVAPGELGLAGQSDGGQVVGMLSFDTRVRLASPAIRAEVILSGVANGTDPYAGGPGHPALLMVQSSRDTCNTPQQASDLYDAIAQPDKWFLEDHARTHLGPYVGTEQATFAAVAAVTARFLALELRGRAPGARFLALGNAHPSVARLTHELMAPAMPGQGDGGVGCYDR